MLDLSAVETRDVVGVLASVLLGRKTAVFLQYVREVALARECE